MRKMDDEKAPGSRLDTLGAALPELARDVRRNVEAVLQEGSLSPAQRWGVAVASAAAARNARLREAVIESALREVEPAVVEDGLAAAAMMALGNVLFRFGHLSGKAAYGAKPPRLHLDRLARPATNRANLELFSLVVSAVNGCELCIRSHEQSLLDLGLTEDQLHDAVRIAATMHAAAVALEL